MSSVKISREENRERRINEILDAAEQAFVENGFRGASIGSIAKGAGISIGHLYHYFPNKDAIVLAMIRRDDEQKEESLRELEEAEPDAFIDIFVEGSVRIAAEHMDFLRSAMSFEILAESQRNPAVAELMQDLDRQKRIRFAALLRNKLGLEDAEERTEMIFALMSGIASRYARYPDREKEKQGGMISTMVRSILTGRFCGQKTK